MKKGKKFLEKKYENLFKRAKDYYNVNQYNKAERALISCYRFYLNENYFSKLLEVGKFLVEFFLTIENFSKVKRYADELLRIAQERRNYKIIGEIYNSLGRYYKNIGESKTAERFYTQSINICKKHSFNKEMAIAQLNLGEVLKFKGDIEGALDLFLISGKYFNSIGEYVYSIAAYISISSTFADIGRLVDLENSLKKIEEMVVLLDIRSPKILISTYSNIGLLYGYLSKQEKSLFYNLKALNIARQKGYKKSIDEIHLNLGYNYMSLGNGIKAQDFFKKALSGFKSSNDNQGLCRVYLGLGELNMNIEKAHSITFLKLALRISESTDDIYCKIRVYRHLGEINFNLENFNESYRNYNQCLIQYERIFQNIFNPHIQKYFKRLYEDIPVILKNINQIIENSEVEFSDLNNTKLSLLNTCVAAKEYVVLPKNIYQSMKDELKKLKDIINNKDLKELEKEIIKELCLTVGSYSGKKIDQIEIFKFLNQISNTIIKHSILVNILSRLHLYFFTKDMMINKLVEKVQTLPYPEETQLRFVILDSMWDKSPTFCSYFLKKRLKLGSQVIIIEKSSNFIKNMSKIPSNKEVVAIFIDDVIGTGKQFVKRYKSDFEMKYEKWNLKDKKNISYYLVAGVGSIDSIDHISSNTLLSKDSIRYSKLIRKSDKAFYPPIWNNKEELTKIKEFLKDIDSKYWDGWKETGDDGLQYLVILDWNTPNNTIGCLWNRTESWDPLFPRSS